VPARHSIVLHRAAVPAVLWAKPAAHGTAHGLLFRAVPPMGHGQLRRAVSAHGPSVEKTVHFHFDTTKNRIIRK